MNYRIVRGLKVVLLVGLVAGFGVEAVHARRASHHRREAFEHHVAELCVEAARGTDARGGAAPPPAVVKD
jgi:hypothetical protein